MEEKIYYDIKALAKKLDISTRTVMRYLDNGTLKGFKIGAKWYISQDELNRLEGI